MNKDYTLYAGTFKLIKELLMTGGWNTTLADIYNAGKLIEALPEPKGASIAEASTLVTANITSKQYETITKAIKYHASKSTILPTMFAVQLIESFELLSE